MTNTALFLSIFSVQRCEAISRRSSKLMHTHRHRRRKTKKVCSGVLPFSDAKRVCDRCSHCGSAQVSGLVVVQISASGAHVSISVTSGGLDDSSGRLARVCPTPRARASEELETGRTVAIPDGWRSAMDRMFHTEQRCAIRGISGRFCSSWSVVDWCSGQLGGTDFVTRVPLKRWDTDRYFDPDPEAWRQGKTYLTHSSFCDGVELFDCRFFGLSPMEAGGMDPHQRQVLEVGYEACFRAGYQKRKLMNCLGGVRAGVFCLPP